MAKKTFYYKETRKKNSYTISATVFQIKSGKIVEIGNLSFNAKSGKGVKTEIYSLLHSKKLVSSKEFKENKGYYLPYNTNIILSEL